ncbi:hypothetical protein IU498_02010 [Nocardia beijingensis]|uniref:hypothetical protein n=1 Tax=Nocardia beijingensis TaxID=95162 RepID=UPI0018954429|nr:hypothetical protein [Nocardia beijingensis]MBF6073398.1 hypothetical protein [Nocardia beijingensis]
MVDFSVDLNQLVSASNAWARASDHLDDAARKAREIRDSNQEVVWALYEEAWAAQVAAAQYMQDRLTEGRTETQSIGNVLAHVAKVYAEQDESFAHVLIKLNEG